MKILIKAGLIAFSACVFAGCGHSAPTEPPSFDVPILVGKNIDEVKAILGAPSDDDEIKFPNGFPDGSSTGYGKEWDKPGDKSLLATFTQSTRKIEDFFISCDDTSGACSDKSHLLQIGNLKQDAPNYSIEFVNAGASETKFTGVKAIPR